MWKREAPNHLRGPRLGESPEHHLIDSMFWYSIKDEASAIRIEPKPDWALIQDGAFVQFCINDVFRNKCEIGAELLALLMHRFQLMLPSNKVIRIVIDDNWYYLTFRQETTGTGRRVTMEIAHAGIYRDTFGQLLEEMLDYEKCSIEN